MKKRILLLPGFGEDTFCFNELLEFIDDNSYEIIHVDYRKTLNQFTFPIITRKQFCKRLIEQYDIQKDDKLIGHSMGGYFAFQIREIIGSEICMIASFSDTKKVIHTVPKFPRITQIAAYTGLIKTSFLKKYLLDKIKNEDYKKVQKYIMENFNNFSNKELALMTEMFYEKGIQSNLPNPLRIHDKADKVCKFPDEDFIQIPGGHFNLNLYPAETYEAMKDFLKS